jgi:hypothetical protein
MRFEVEHTETPLGEGYKYIEVNISNEELKGMFTYGNTIDRELSTEDEVNYARLHLYNKLPIELKSAYEL